MKRTNRQWVLAARPKGMPGRDNFELRETPAPEPADGQFLVRNLYLSCDPTQRGWMERDTYVPAVAIGEVMRAASCGEVIASRHAGFREGDRVSGAFGWQDYAVSDGGGFWPVTKLPPGVPIPNAMSLLGVTGLTAYFGITEIGKPQPGETVLVSGAAGATGSAAAQIARILGARVVGIAGGPRKCEFLTKELGLDAAIDYRAENVGQRIGELCPKGIDVYFDNVGGAILDAALAHLAWHGRIILCGAISAYNDLDGAPGIRNYLNLIIRGGTARGFLVFEYAHLMGKALEDLARWWQEGKLRDQVDIVDGLENAPDALRRLFTGENLGKQLVRVADKV